MSNYGKVSESIAQQAQEVVAHLPPGSFTFEDFAGHATGLNVLLNASDVGPMLEYLTDNEVIQRLPVPAGKPARWARGARGGAPGGVPARQT